ncbi:hypothetical protein RJ641_021923, partial [Dillenia turbinata]
KDHQAIDILLAEIDIYELFAFKHCRGSRVKLALGDGEEYDESHKKKAIDTFLAHLGSTLCGSMTHIISPSIADGAFLYYEKISIQLFSSPRRCGGSL